MGIIDSARLQSSVCVRILLAEDNPINQKLAAALLQRKGWDVTAVDNGRKVLDILNKNRFDMILMDIQMPELDGTEVASYIRAKERTGGGHIPIIAMTAYAMKGDREKLTKSGMDDYVSKPIDIEEFYKVIEKYVNRDNGKNILDNPPVDLSPLSEALEDEEVIKELVDTLIISFPEQMMQLKKAVEEGDFKKLERRAHSFRGSISNFRADGACLLLEQIETISRSGSMSGVGNVLDKLEGELEHIREYLSSR